jgi:hypothetical protein
MSAVQTFIPGIPYGPIDTALVQVRGLTLAHNNYQCLVRDVAAKALGHRRGAVILCAAPSDITCAEIVGSVTAEIAARYNASDGKPFPGVRVIDTPTGLRRGSGAGLLLDSYHHPIEQPGTKHRFDLLPGDAFVSRDPLHQVSSLIRHTSPVACFIRNVHALQTARHGIDGAVDAVTTYVEIAERSSCTHILIGHTGVVLEWLKRPELTLGVSSCVLAPYDLRDELDHANFVEVLRAYDSILPWQGDSLEAHMEEVDQVVSGSPSRLREWLVEALCYANAERADHLDWDQMAVKQPSRGARMAAWNERLSALEYLEADGTATDSGAKSDAAESKPRERAKGLPPPGIRKPNRNGRAAA